MTSTAWGRPFEWTRWNHAIAARYGERGLRRILAEEQPHKTPAAS